VSKDSFSDLVVDWLKVNYLCFNITALESIFYLKFEWCVINLFFLKESSMNSLNIKKKGLTMNRNTSLEFLRIISMLMIIILHYLGHGDVLENVKLNSLNYILAWSFEAMAFVSVNCYVIISGYFLITSEFKLKRLIKIWIQVIFYSIIIFFVMNLFSITEINTINLLKSFLPVLAKSYWFATTYIALYILFPFLNVLIKFITKKQFQQLLIILISMFCIWPNLIPFSKTLESGGGNGIVWFVCLYLISAYIRLYYNKPIKPIKALMLYLGCSLLIVSSKIILENLTINILGYSVGSNIFYQYNSILVLISSISLFLFFNNLNIINIRLNKIIISLSGLTFGVYLIHDNILVRNVLWSEIINTANFANTNFFVIHLILSTAAIFTLCSLIEFLRKFFIDKFENKLIDKICSYKIFIKRKQSIRN
jgi:surface polysaccharide O-acyltransferase-like enzyme